MESLENSDAVADRARHESEPHGGSADVQRPPTTTEHASALPTDATSEVTSRAPDTHLRAATLVVTYETQRGPRVILTRRPASLRRHPGQISFPGGMVEPTDETPLAAAVREAREEIGIRLSGYLPATPLTAVTTLSSGIVIQPFWVRLAASPRLRVSADEVEQVLRVPLEALSAPGALRPIPHPRRPNEQTLAYVWRGHVIWGATAQTIGELLRIYPFSARTADPSRARR